MHLLLIFFFCIIGLQIGVFAELTLSQCAVLRTATSLTTIAPELAQLAMRYYRVSSSPSTEQHNRQKRFIFNEITPKDATVVKGSVLEQMVANAFKDVNYTKVALLVVHNNESMARIRQNVNGEAIVRAAMRGIDYEKLGGDLWYAAEAEFDLEYFISTIINMTHLDLIHEQLLTTGNLPDWLIKNIHPDLNVQTVQRIFELMKNYTRKFITIMNSQENLDNYLFNTIQQQALTPLGDIIQRINNEKPTTLDRLVEIILDNVDKIVKVKYFFFSEDIIFLNLY
jgi:hypothetical protein